jgi:hypothetical protein
MEDNSGLEQILPRFIETDYTEERVSKILNFVDENNLLIFPRTIDHFKNSPEMYETTYTVIESLEQIPSPSIRRDLIIDKLRDLLNNPEYWYNADQD